MKVLKIGIVGVATMVILLVIPLSIAQNEEVVGDVSGGEWFVPFLTDPGLKEFNVTISSDIDRYNFAKVWMELNASEQRPIRFLLPPLAWHYGDGNFTKMEIKIEWIINISSPVVKKEFEQKKDLYRLYLMKKYNITAPETIK